MKGLASNGIIADLAEYVYRVSPSLRPFSDGDAAERLGHESAVNFAARKWAEQAISKERSMTKARTERAKRSYRR